MKLREVIFTDSLPTLDLHGYDSLSAQVKIKDFIQDNIILKEEIIVIVHGIGTGILKNITQKTLKRNKKVIDYQLFYRNNGMTIVQLDIDKS